MPIFHLVPRNKYHKNGTQWIGKIVCGIIGEKNYEWIRLEKRIFYAKYWYKKQALLLKFWYQYPAQAQWFSLLNKQDTSNGFPARRAYERYSDFALFNINSEGWFQCYFIIAAISVLIWNYWILAVYYDIRGLINY